MPGCSTIMRLLWKKEKWHVSLSLVEMCVYNFLEICGVLFETVQSCALWKPIVANQDEIWEMVQICVDHMTMGKG